MGWGDREWRHGVEPREGSAGPYGERLGGQGALSMREKSRNVRGTKSP